MPFILPQDATAYRLYYVTGSTVTGSADVDMGIYAANKSRIVSSGIVAFPTGTASSMITVDIANTALTADTLYYLAIAVSSIAGTCNFLRFNAGTRGAFEQGLLSETGLTTLPGTATWALGAGSTIAYCGLILRSEIT